MVVAGNHAQEQHTTELAVSQIKVGIRMRRTDPEAIEDLAESISGIGLLHPVTVADTGDSYLLLSGLHRLEAFKILKKETIPANIVSGDDLVYELIECEENLVRCDLNAIQTAEHIVRREELLVQLGRKAVVGNNQYSEKKLTNEELARQMGMTKRTYQYKKAVANLNPEVKDLLCETKFAENLMDMVKLQKEPDRIQLEVANLLFTGKAKTFNRAFMLGRLKYADDTWTDETAEMRERLGSVPKSVMRFERQKNKLNDICQYVSKSEDTQVVKKSTHMGTNDIHNYSMMPEHSRWFVNFYSQPGDLVLDNFCGRGTNIITAAYEGRKVVGYDLTPTNLDLIRSACLEHTDIDASDLTLHCSDGVELTEYSTCSDCFDLVLTDPPFYYHKAAENYSDDSRDLCQSKTIDEFLEKIETCLLNLHRLIKPSNFDEKVFHPVVLKVGLGRKGELGMRDMATDIEIIARKIGLVLHDKIITELKPTFLGVNVHRSIEHRYTVKAHETNLVFVKYAP